MIKQRHYFEVTLAGLHAIAPKLAESIRRCANDEEKLTCICKEQDRVPVLAAYLQALRYADQGCLPEPNSQTRAQLADRHLSKIKHAVSVLNGTAKCIRFARIRDALQTFAEFGIQDVKVAQDLLNRLLSHDKRE
jgi:hypothetical protein